MQTTNKPWRRFVAHGALLALGLWAGCSGDDDASPTKPPKTNDSKPPAGMTEPEPGTPGETPAAMPSPNISVAANDPMTRSPFDATPSPKGERVYYTALGGQDGESQPGVFSVAADGGGDIATLALGEPLTAPVNITVSLDGKQLFVADPAASAIFSLPAEGGTPAVLAGTEGYAPRGLVIAKDPDKREYLYFTGRKPEGEIAGLFRIQPAGGAVETVAMGEPFADPAGVVVDAKGVAYVVETTPDSATANVIRVEGGKTSTFVESVGIGFPAGITLTTDDKTLLVSGLDPETKHDLVYFVDTASRRVSRLTKTVGQFTEAAGLHRAHDADVFAWADSEANGGTVYLLTPGKDL